MSDKNRPWYSAKPWTKEYKEKHQPVTGGLYRARKASSPSGKTKLLKGEIVMVVSKLHCLMDIRRVRNGRVETTHEWLDLYVLFKEKVHNFSGFKDQFWYDWFERVSPDDK